MPKQGNYVFFSPAKTSGTTLFYIDTGTGDHLTDVLAQLLSEGKRSQKASKQVPIIKGQDNQVLSEINNIK